MRKGFPGCMATRVQLWLPTCLISVLGATGVPEMSLANIIMMKKMQSADRIMRSILGF